MPSLVTVTLHVVSYETCEDGTGDRRFQPRHLVLHYVAMLIGDVVVVRQRLGNFSATFEYVVTLVADGYLTSPAYFCVVVSTTTTPFHIFWAAEHGSLGVVPRDCTTPLEGIVWEIRIHLHCFVQASLLPKIAIEIVVETLLCTPLLIAVQKLT